MELYYFFAFAKNTLQPGRAVDCAGLVGVDESLRFLIGSARGMVPRGAVGFSQGAAAVMALVREVVPEWVVLLSPVRWPSAGLKEARVLTIQGVC